MNKKFIEKLMAEKKALLEQAEPFLEKARKIDAAIEVYEEYGGVETELPDPSNSSRNRESVAQLTSPSNGKLVTSLTDYNYIWNKELRLQARIKVLIGSIGRFVHVRELTAIIKTFEPDNDGNLQRRVSDALSTLGAKADSGLVKKKTGVASNSVVWGLATWMDGNEIKKEYLYNADFIPKNDFFGIKKPLAETSGQNS